MAAVQLTTGLVLKFSVETQEMMPWEAAGTHEELQLLTVCPRAKVANVQGKEYFVGLSERHRMYRYGNEVGAKELLLKYHHCLNLN